MFSIYKNFVLSLSILSCTSAPLPNVDKVPEPLTVTDLEKQVQQEIVPFRELLNEFNPATPLKENQILAKGMILGKFDMLARQAIKADALIKELAEEKGVLKTQRNDSMHKIKTLEVPLVFRNYVNKVEDDCPGVNAVVPKNVKNNQKLHMGVLTRKYNWIKILTEDKYSENVYVQLLKPALKKEFFSEEKIIEEKEIEDLTTEQKKKYEKFLDKFCEGIAVSVDYVNKIIAHNDFGRYPGDDLLNMFSKAYDKYVSLFYHAVVG